MRPASRLYRLSKLTKRAEKDDFLKESLQDDEFRIGLYYALNPYITFNITDHPDVPSSHGVKDHWLTFTEFEEFLQKLMKRQLTGSAAIKELYEVKGKSSTDDWNGWYSRILNKDLDCGVGVSTANRVLKSMNKPLIPVFSCQLAGVLGGIGSYQNLKTGLYFAEPKLDGCRVLTVIDKEGNIIHYTRNGKTVSLPLVTESLQRFASSERGKEIVFDGEVCDVDFNTLMTKFRTKKETDQTTVKYTIFDVIPLELFANKNETTAGPALWQRKKVLEQIKADYPELIIGEYRELYKEDLENYFNECLERGFEGIMIKDRYSMYQYKRSKDWLKLKPFEDMTMTITEVIPGEGKYLGKLGAVVAIAKKFNGSAISCRIGSGFSDIEREELNTDDIVGKEIDVIYDSITPDGSLRFPRFRRLR